MLTPIDDLGIEYTQILFKAKPNYYFDYAKGGGANANNWDFNGYSFPLNTLRFDSKIIIISNKKFFSYLVFEWISCNTLGFKKQDHSSLIL